MASSTSSTISSKIELPSTHQVLRLQRLKGAAKADSIEYEWKIAGLLALRAHKKGFLYEIFSNVDVARPFDDVVLRLLGPPDLLPSTVTYFLQLKHTRPDGKDKTVTKQALINKEGKGDFSLKKYFDWFLGFYMTPSVLSHDQLQLLDTECVRLVFFTNKDVMPEARKDSSRKDLQQDPFEEIFQTKEGGVAFSFDSSFQKIWKLEDENDAKDCCKREFLGNLKIFCKQASSREIDEMIRKELTEVFGKKGERFLAPFLRFLNEWSADDINDFCLSNNILLDFCKKQFRERMHSSVCRKLKFKPESLMDLRAALRKAGSQLRVSVLEAPKPGLRAAKVLQAVSEEFGEDKWLYVDAWVLKGFRLNFLADACSNVSFLITDVEGKEDVALAEKLIASIRSSGSSAKVVEIALRKASGCDFEDIWRMRDLDEDSQKNMEERRIFFQGEEQCLEDMKETWTTMREDIGGDVMASEEKEVSIGKENEKLEDEMLDRTLSHHHMVSEEVISDKGAVLNGGRLALLGFPVNILEQCARQLGILNPDDYAEEIDKRVKDNARWTVLNVQGVHSLKDFKQIIQSLKKEKSAAAVHLLEYVSGSSVNDVRLMWRDSVGPEVQQDVERPRQFHASLHNCRKSIRRSGSSL